MKGHYTFDDLDFLTPRFETPIERYKFDYLDYSDKCYYIIFIALSNGLESPLYLENGDFYDVDTNEKIYDYDAGDYDPNYDENHDLTVIDYAYMLNDEATDLHDKLFKKD